VIRENFSSTADDHTFAGADDDDDEDDDDDDGDEDGTEEDPKVADDLTPLTPLIPLTPLVVTGPILCVLVMGWKS
jgi:hypothetical protein